jgi:AcrR family transcriptional regulator
VRPGATARDEILDAAAELFTSQGYGNTSTRAIADAVGIRQSSLYHHFATKDDILAELLSGTVAAGLGFAKAVAARPLPDDFGHGGLHQASQAAELAEHGDLLSAAARLHAVALFDGTQLCTVRWNLGVLYHLPEARAERFRTFFEERNELRQVYREMGNQVEGYLGHQQPGSIGEIAFRLVESLISLRADGLVEEESAGQTADAALALAGLGAELDAVRRRSADLIRAFGGS